MLRKIIAVLLFVGGIGVASDGNVISGIIAIILAILIWPKSKEAQRSPQVVQPKADARPNGTISKTDINKNWRLDDYVVFDVETTGLHPKSDRIIEIGAVKVSGGRVIDSFSSLVCPERNISTKIEGLTGIKNEDLRFAPAQSDVIPRFYYFSRGYTLVAHNADFDAGFLGEALLACGISASIDYVDTLQLARERLPGLPNYKLATLIDTFGLLDHAQTHRALDDVIATKNLYELIKAGR